MTSSQTLSSGLHVQSELLNEIATLRSALAQSNQQLERAHAAGFMASSSSGGRATPSAAGSRRDRRVTMPAPSSGHNTVNNVKHNKQQQQNATTGTAPGRLSMSINTTAAEQRHRRNSSAVVPSAVAPDNTPAAVSPRSASRATTIRPPSVQTTPRSASASGYAGAPPSSLATPTSASTPAFTLKRDTAYEDLARVMNAPSPNPASRIANGLGISSPPHRRTSSLNSNASNGTPTSLSKVPMPVIAPGSVGTATTLAGGSNSPKTPLSADKTTFDGTPIRPKHAHSNKDESNSVPNGVLRDATNGAMRNNHSDSPDCEADKLSNSASTLGLPPLPHSMPNNMPSGMRSPHLSSDGENEYSPATTMDYSNDDEPQVAVRRQSKSSAGMSRGGSSPFFGGSAGFTERHGEDTLTGKRGLFSII